MLLGCLPDNCLFHAKEALRLYKEIRQEAEARFHPKYDGLISLAEKVLQAAENNAKEIEESKRQGREEELGKGADVDNYLDVKDPKPAKEQGVVKDRPDTEENH
jgi:hypothetical protein